MHAVVKTGGKQYRVKEGDVFYVEKLPGEKDSQVVLDHVLLITNEEGGDPQVGAPYLEKARVACEIVEQFRGKKILVYKFKRRQKYRKRQGHRQYYTRLRVLEIAPDGEITGKRPEPRQKAKDVAPVEAPVETKEEAVGFESAAVEAKAATEAAES